MDGTLLFFENIYRVGSIRVHPPWGWVVWTISLHPQKLHVKINIMRGQNFFWIYKKLVLQLLKHSHFLTNCRFWPDLRIWDRLQIEHNIELPSYIFKNGIANILISKWTISSTLAWLGKQFHIDLPDYIRFLGRYKVLSVHHIQLNLYQTELLFWHEVVCWFLKIYQDLRWFAAHAHKIVFALTFVFLLNVM